MKSRERPLAGLSLTLFPWPLFQFKGQIELSVPLGPTFPPQDSMSPRHTRVAELFLGINSVYALTWFIIIIGPDAQSWLSIFPGLGRVSDNFVYFHT